jgi:hypothetical protein
MKQPVLGRRPGGEDMIGELETALEGARGDALIENLALFALALRRTVRTFSRVSIDNSLSAKPATAMVMR